MGEGDGGGGGGEKREKVQHSSRPFLVSAFFKKNLLSRGMYINTFEADCKILKTLHLCLTALLL